ncbi:unnamed protein product [Chondrus crispus]|uniref:Anoctamin transmembrane domain-containing protein n=1 Tax=Chondrus crispus TaxID=2769 RepID=R7Q6U9_CHOCR|nr:unnamed protein product [Chondrus crispus]CDF33096.1 unnamed protein product [Chondrus crispus]|eukprot:XP_005712899.1 unnamed protein product [Chondrus crispus]
MKIRTLRRSSGSTRPKLKLKRVIELGLCFWGTYWLDYWKRRNAVLNVKWGLDKFYEDNENDIRADFEGDDRQGFYCRGGFVNLEDLGPERAAADNFERAREPGLRSRIRGQLLRVTGAHAAFEPSGEDVIRIGGGNDPDFVLDAPITGLTFSSLPVFPYASKRDVQRRVYISSLVTLFFASCVGACSFLNLFFKKSITGLFGSHAFAKFAPGMAQAVIISVADPLWKRATLKLSKWENHRTTQASENSIITKRFAFQFVSSKFDASLQAHPIRF